eukprot:gnl/TRDRNA2_/TRDRNA2_207679_c0_seq1.p1 gnl/TRDRNA2_/TRDRNA2_207679_c0~~gnl/TRDRNA2_/TRDRNA2_207679_c0_seq1.p1  ORF type:complete len:120 (-),score=16.11 gnl/TRDRNA2_/TRDRNA2_207679_c0_seq1:11-370(-)
MQSPPDTLQPISVLLDAIKLKDTEPQARHYQMIMGYLAASAQIVAGFVLLERAEDSGLLERATDSGLAFHSYPIFSMLLKACGVVNDTAGASRVQAMVERIGLTSTAAAASASKIKLSL